MSDRFDHTFDRKLETKADEAGEPSTPARRMELITGTARRRDWSDDDKARIIVESLAPGANISAVARRHGIKPQQLFGWRREARELFRDCLDTAAARPSPHPSTGPSSVPPATATKARLSENATTFAEVVMAPAVTTPASLAPPPASPPASTKQSIEIAIGTVIVRVGTDVDAEALGRVLAAVRRSS